MSAGSRWAAVVVEYRSGAALETCVRSLVDDDGAGGCPDVVVVDNGPGDARTRLAALGGSVRVIPTGRNAGYAAAANLGIAATDAPVVLVCNPDVEQARGSAPAVLARFDAEPDLGAVGPSVREPDGTPYPSARIVPGAGVALGHALLGGVLPANPWTLRYRQLGADPFVPRDVDWVSGAAIWLRRRATEEVGGWDEGYFMYVEDVDLCRRLTQAGWRVAYEPAASVVHAHGVSTAAAPYRMIVAHHRSLFRFAAKHWQGARRLLLVPAAAVLGVRAGVLLIVRAVKGSSRRAPSAGN